MATLAEREAAAAPRDVAVVGEDRAPGPQGLFTRFPVTAFLVLAFGLQIGIVATQYYGIRNYGASAVRVFTPALSGVLVAWLAYGKKTAWKCVASLVDVRVPLKYWAFALLYPSFVAVLALGILRAVGAVQEIHFDFQEAAGWDFFWMTVKVAASDEVAWVSFLFMVVARRYRLFQASLFVGLFWGLWYLPLVFAEIQVAPGLPVAPLVVNFVTIASICGWLYLRTGSAAVVFVMQATTNYTSQIIPVLPQRGGVPQYVAFVVMKCLFGFALYFLWGPKPLFGNVAPGTSSLDRPAPAPAGSSELHREKKES